MSPYRSEERGAAFAVVDERGEVVLACGDEMTAARWAATLNEAFRRGYRAGWRDGKRGEPPAD